MSRSPTSTRPQPRKPRETPLADAVLAALRTTDRAPHEIADKAGVSPSSISRFVSGESSLSLVNADALAAELGVKAYAPRAAAKPKPRK